MESRENKGYLHQAQWHPFSQTSISFLPIPCQSNYGHIITAHKSRERVFPSFLTHCKIQGLQLDHILNSRILPFSCPHSDHQHPHAPRMREVVLPSVVCSLSYFILSYSPLQKRSFSPGLHQKVWGCLKKEFKEKK